MRTSQVHAFCTSFRIDKRITHHVIETLKYKWSFTQSLDSLENALSVLPKVGAAATRPLHFTCGNGPPLDEYSCNHPRCALALTRLATHHQTLQLKVLSTVYMPTLYKVRLFSECDETVIRTISSLFRCASPQTQLEDESVLRDSQCENVAN